MKEIARVLVIKFGGLAEFVAAVAAMKRIREAYPSAHTTLLTTAPFAALAKASGYFNAIETTNPLSAFALAQRVKRAKADLVFDLDGTARGAAARLLAWPFRPVWSVAPIALGATLADRHARQLKAAGLWPDAPGHDAPPSDISWIANLAAQARPDGRTRPYVILAPGAPEGRQWPIEKFGALALSLRERGYDVVVVGELDDGALARQIQRADSKARDLTGRTDYAVIAALASRATLAIGSENPLLHLAAAAGAPTIGIYARTADLRLSAPRGHVTLLQADDLARLEVTEVMRATGPLTPAPAG